MERKRPRTHNVQIFGLMCGTKKISRCQGGTLPIPKYVSVCKKNF